MSCQGKPYTQEVNTVCRRIEKLSNEDPTLCVVKKFLKQNYFS